MARMRAPADEPAAERRHEPRPGGGKGYWGGQRVPSIELAGEGGGGACDPQFGCSYSGTIAFRTPTQPLPMEHNPRKAFYRLFGLGDNAAERHSIVEETGSILDYVTANAADLKRQLGTS